jgi:hypothetical protein
VRLTVNRFAASAQAASSRGAGRPEVTQRGRDRPRSGRAPRSSCHCLRLARLRGLEDRLGDQAHPGPGVVLAPTTPAANTRAAAPPRTRAPSSGRRWLPEWTRRGRLVPSGSSAGWSREGDSPGSADGPRAGTRGARQAEGRAEALARTRPGGGGGAIVRGAVWRAVRNCVWRRPACVRQRPRRASAGECPDAGSRVTLRW